MKPRDPDKKDDQSGLGPWKVYVFAASVLFSVAAGARPTFGEPHVVRVDGEIMLLGKDVHATIQLPSKEACRAARRIMAASDARDFFDKAVIGECEAVVAARTPVLTSEPCWPAGAPSTAGLAVLETGRYPVRAEGGLVPLRVVTYGTDGVAAVVVGWHRGRVVTVDPKPGDDATPTLWDARDLSPENLLLDARAPGPCRWRTLGEKAS